MKLDEVKARLIGKAIKEIRASEWNDDNAWLVDGWHVEIILDDGTLLDSLGEPVGVSFPEANEVKK